MASKKELDRLHESILVRNENRLERELSSFFTLLYLAMIESLKEAGISASRGKIQELTPQLQDILENGYNRAASDSLSLTNTMLPDENYIENAVILSISVWAASEAIKISKIIMNTTLNEFDKILSDNATNNTLDVPADDIIKELRKRNRDRVGGIGTTESNKAIGEGQRQTVEEIQRQQVFEIRKYWRSKRDIRVRETHSRADSRYSRDPIPVNHNFEVGAGFGQYPLDETLPLDEKIRCRCYTIYRKMQVV